MYEEVGSVNCLASAASRSASAFFLASSSAFLLASAALALASFSALATASAAAFSAASAASFGGLGVDLVLLVLDLGHDPGAQRLAGAGGVLLGVRRGHAEAAERGGGAGGSVVVRDEGAHRGQVRHGDRHRRLAGLGTGHAARADGGYDADAEDGGAAGETSAALLADAMPAAYGTDGLLGGVPLLERALVGAVTAVAEGLGVALVLRERGLRGQAGWTPRGRTPFLPSRLPG